MFDWNTQLELSKSRIVELEEQISRLREALHRNTDDPQVATPIQRILERDQGILSIKMTSLERAKLHQRYIESKVRTVLKPVSYAELARVCFNTAKSMPPGDAADLVRAHGDHFYTKAVSAGKTFSN
jgi:hypothetical protein